MDRKLRFAPTILLAAVSAFACVAINAGQSGSAQDLQGKAVDPIKSSGGRVVVLLFVRTDCPISNRYVPEIQKLNEEFRGKAEFWMIYPDEKESASLIRQHQAEFHLAIPALRDLHLTLVNRAQATITPEAAVFTREGKLIYHGRIDNWYEDFGRARATPTTHELADAIRSALEGKAMNPNHASAVGCYISDLK